MLQLVTLAKRINVICSPIVIVECVYFIIFLRFISFSMAVYTLGFMFISSCVYLLHAFVCTHHRGLKNRKKKRKTSRTHARNVARDLNTIPF